jgi:hypothetical protein
VLRLHFSDAAIAVEIEVQKPRVSDAAEVQKPQSQMSLHV